MLKNVSFYKNVMQQLFLTLIILNNAENKEIRMISEGSCDTKC